MLQVLPCLGRRQWLNSASKWTLSPCIAGLPVQIVLPHKFQLDLGVMVKPLNWEPPKPMPFIPLHSDIKAVCDIAHKEVRVEWLPWLKAAFPVRQENARILPLCPEQQMILNKNSCCIPQQVDWGGQGPGVKGADDKRGSQD